MVVEKKCFFVLLALLATVFANSTPVNQCNEGPMPINVNIYGCDEPPCALYIGTDAQMDITFKIPKFSTTIRPRVRATVEGITTLFPLPPNGCPNLVNGYCPVTEGEVLVYHFRMPMFNIPLVSVHLEFWLEAGGERITCFLVDCVVATLPKSLN